MRFKTCGETAIFVVFQVTNVTRPQGKSQMRSNDKKVTSLNNWPARLLALRRKLKYDQEQMAGELGVGREWVSRLEREKGTFSSYVKEKIERLEHAASHHNIDPSSHVAVEEPSAHFGERLKSKPPLHNRDLQRTPPSTQTPAQSGRVISPNDSHLPLVPPNPPSAQDVRAYVELLLAATDGDPKRVGRLLDSLHEQWDSTRQYWLKNPNA